MISQNRSTTSWTVFSQTPCNSTLWRLHYFHTRNKNTLTESQVTSLQNPWIHGVPLGRISNGSTGLQESFKVVRQQRLHEFSTKKIDLMRSNISWKYFHLWTKLEISNQQKIYDFIKSLKGMIRTSVTSSSPTRKKIIRVIFTFETIKTSYFSWKIVANRDNRRTSKNQDSYWIPTFIAHTALQSLSFAVGYAASSTALPTFQTGCPIGHWWTRWAFWGIAEAFWFFFARRMLSVATFHSSWHELTVVAAGRIFIAANER